MYFLHLFFLAIFPHEFEPPIIRTAMDGPSSGQCANSKESQEPDTIEGGIKHRYRNRKTNLIREFLQFHFPEL